MRIYSDHIYTSPLRRRGLTIVLLLVSSATVSTLHAQNRLEAIGKMYLDRSDLLGSYSWGVLPGDLPAIDRSSSWAPEALLWQGEQRIELEQLGPARFMMSEVADEYPNTSSATMALLNQGIIAIRNGAYGKARIYFDETIIKGSAEHTPEGERVAGTALYLIAYTHALEGEQPVEKTVALLEDFLDNYPGNPREVDALYTLGEIAEMKGNYEGAIDYYDRIIRKGSGRLYFEARNHRAQSLARLGRYRDAQDELAGIERDLYSAPAAGLEKSRFEAIRADCMLLRGEIEIALGNYSAAEAAFVGLMNGSERYRRKGLLGLADTYQSAGRNDSALAIYSRLVADDTSNAVFQRAEFNQAIALRGLGRSEEATTIFESIGGDSLHLMNDRALVELAMIRYQSKDYPAAAAVLNQAIVLAKDDRTRIRAYMIKGVVELGGGEPARAIESFDAAEKLSVKFKEYKGPELAEAKLLSGITMARTNRSAEAITTLNRFLDQYPAHTGRDEALYWLGESHYQSGLYKGAVDVMEDLIEQYPGSPRVADAMYTTGWAHFRQRRFDRAEASFSQLIKAFPLSGYVAEAQLRRGDGFYLAKQYADAARAYSQVRKMNPTAQESTHAAYQEALAYMQLGDLAVADSLFRNFAACNTATTLTDDALYRRGEIALRRSDYAQAVGVLKPLLGRGVREELLPAAYEALGDAYLKLGDLQGAAGAYSIVAERFPKNSAAQKAGRGISDALAAWKNDERTSAECGSGVLGMARARVYLDTYHPSEALREYRTLERGAADGVCRQQILLGIGRSHLAAGDLKAAADTLRLLVERYPDGQFLPGALLALGEAGLAGRDSAMARAYYEQVRTSYPDSSESVRARLHLSELYAAAGMRDTAGSILYENVSRFPNSTVAQWSWLGLATVDTTAGRRDTIVAALRSLAGRRDTLGAESAFLLARMAADSGRLQESVDMLEEVSARFKGENAVASRAVLAIGEAYQRMGAPEKAKAAYERILQFYCDETLRKKAEEQIQALSKL